MLIHTLKLYADSYAYSCDSVSDCCYAQSYTFRLSICMVISMHLLCSSLIRCVYVYLQCMLVYDSACVFPSMSIVVHTVIRIEIHILIVSNLRFNVNFQVNLNFKQKFPTFEVNIFSKLEFKKKTNAGKDSTQSQGAVAGPRQLYSHAPLNQTLI